MKSKMLSYLYRKFQCGHKTIIRSSFLHCGISFTGKMASLYWIRPLGNLVSSLPHCLTLSNWQLGLWHCKLYCVWNAYITIQHYTSPYITLHHHTSSRFITSQTQPLAPYQYAVYQLCGCIPVSKIRKNIYRSDERVTLALNSHLRCLQVLYTKQNYIY